MTKDTEALREAVEQVKQLAQRDMARTQTDFLGRMGQELCDFEAAIEPYPDGELPDDVRGDAYDAISGLAGLAFAQMLMLRGCDHTIFATPASDVAPVEYETLIAAGFDEYAAHCALRTEPDGGFCYAYFYSDGQWRFQTGGNDLTLPDGKLLRCVLTKRLYAHPPHPAPVDSDEAVRLLRGIVRLSEMGFDASMREPEEDGNYAVYTRAKAFLDGHPSSVALSEALRDIPDEVYRHIAESKDVGNARSRVADLVAQLPLTTPVDPVAGGEALRDALVSAACDGIADDAKCGHPKHPLMLPYSSAIMNWNAP